MKKIIVIVFLLATSLFAESFNKQSILGVWEVSSKDLNGFASFGKDFSKNRGEVYSLVFDRRGLVKNKTTGSVYNYEIINHQLKIYETIEYKNNYRIRRKKNFDLWAMNDSYENCNIAKIVKKKLRPSYYRKEGYKWCKVEDYPQSTFNVNKEDY